VSKTTFNGVSLFANYTSNGNGGSNSTKALFKSSDGSRDHTIDIYTSSEGSSGTKVSLYKSALLSALTINAGALGTAQAAVSGITSTTTFGLFKDSSAAGSAISLNATGLSMGVFEQAVSNIAYLRAQSGGGMSRLNFAADSISSMETNLRAAIGRIEDVDIAAESANLAKYSILTQASAAMVAQANNSNDLALMLLR